MWDRGKEWREGTGGGSGTLFSDCWTPNIGLARPTSLLVAETRLPSRTLGVCKIHD
jgi:hypothetical protein